MFEISTVQICLTLYCTILFSSRFINYIKWHIRLTDIVIIFWNAVFTPGSFIRHDLDVVVVVDAIFIHCRCKDRVRHIGWAAGLP